MGRESPSGTRLHWNQVEACTGRLARGFRASRRLARALASFERPDAGRHTDEVGDLLLFGGCAMLTRQPWTGIVPLAMGLNFGLVIIPAHDAYLAARYGIEFDRYARRTRKLVPLVY